jgi:predicted MFS family arabinose efflux permease
VTPAPVVSHYKWYVLGILTLAQTCHSIDRAIIGLVLEPVGKEFGFSDSQRGIIAGFAYGVFFALAAIPFGIAVDRFSRRKLMTIALTLWSGCTALCGFATGFWSLLAGRASVGIAEAGGTPTGMSLLSDYFVKEQRATALGIWYLSSGVGLSIAFFVGGWVIADHGWRAAFFAAGIPGLVLAPILYLTVREPERGNNDDAPRSATTESLGHRIRTLAAKPGLTHCFIAIILIATGIYGMSTWITAFLIRTHDVPIKQAGLLVAITYGVLGSVGGFAAGWSVDWLNARRGGFDAARTAAFGSVIPLLTALTGMAAMVAPSLNLCLIFLFACGFFSASYNGPVYAVIVTVAGPDLRGLAVSMVQMGANLIGVGAGAFLIGAVSQYVGGTRGVAWGIGFALMFTLWGGLHLSLAARAIRRGALPAAAKLHTPAAMA